MSSVEIVDDRGNVQHIPVPVQGAGFTSDDRQQVRQLVTSPAGRTAAAIAAGNILTSFLGDGVTSAGAAENAAAVIGELGEQLQGGDLAPNRIGPAPVVRTDSGLHVVQQPVEEEHEMPTDYTLPPELDYLNEVEEPEPIAFDDEPEMEPVVQATPELEFDEDDLLDPRIAALVAERDKLKKQAAHERQVRVKTTRPTWEQEARQVFKLGDVPLLDADDLASIKADSKREFMRQAKALADRNKRIIVRVAPQAPQRRPEEVRAEQKAEEWGPPPASMPPSDVTRNDHEARLAKARRSGNLGNIFSALIDRDSGR